MPSNMLFVKILKAWVRAGRRTSAKNWRWQSKELAQGPLVVKSGQNSGYQSPQAER